MNCFQAFHSQAQNFSKHEFPLHPSNIIMLVNDEVLQQNVSAENIAKSLQISIEGEQEETREFIDFMKALSISI